MYPGHFLQNSSIQTHQHPPGEGKAKAGNQTLGRGAVTPCLSQVHSPGSKSRRFSGVGVGGMGVFPQQVLSSKGHLQLRVSTDGALWRNTVDSLGSLGEPAPSNPCSQHCLSPPPHSQATPGTKFAKFWCD